MTANADRGLRPERVAEILVAQTVGAPGRRGSGYLVAPGTVLTAAHVVEGARSVGVRFQADRPGERNTEAVVRWRHDGIDVAVLDLLENASDATADGPADVPSVSYGKAGETDSVLHCSAMGFPRFKLRMGDDGSRFRDAEHLNATCAILSNRREGTLDLAIATPPADDPDPERDAWEGMSGAAVFGNGHLIGVVTRHHRSDGPGRIAASRVDRWADAVEATELAELERLLGGALRCSTLPVAAPAGRLDLIQEVYLAQLADIAPPRLEERDAELDDLVSFCGGSDPYLWIQGPPWAGKTALATWFAQHPPGGVVPVWFFITARYASQADSESYTSALIDQLATLAGREPSVTGSPTARDGERRLLLRQAAERVAQDQGTLLLVVDGLDEDQSRLPGGSGTSIASLLPERLPPNVRVLVTSRTSPGLPADVGGRHPLRHCRVLKLDVTNAARHTEYEARLDLQQALSGDRLQRDLVGLLTAARGTLTVDDLRELTGEPTYELRQRLGSVFGRILRLRGGGESADGDVTLYMSSRGYLFAHETLLAVTQAELGADVDAYWQRLHAWAATYARRGWPESTPAYLLQPYGRLLALLRDARRATALSTDVRRRDRLREATGSDAACLAELRATRQVVRQVSREELGALGALAVVEDLVASRNESLHPDIPAGYARLGRTRQAIGLARSVFRPIDRARALQGVALVLAETGDRRAEGPAQEAARLTEKHWYEDSWPRSSLMAAQGTLAIVLASLGREDEAAHVVGELPPPRSIWDSWSLSSELVRIAVALKDRARAAVLLRRAEETALGLFRETVQDGAFLSDLLPVLVTVAEAWAARGFAEKASRLCDSVLALARRHAGGEDNLPAVAALALREFRPREARLMTELAVAALDRASGHNEDRKAVHGAVRALVAADRMAEAQRLADDLPFTTVGPASRYTDAWSAVAAGWAHQGRVAEAWAALEHRESSEADGCVARIVGFLVRAGAAEELESALLTTEESAPWNVAEALAALAVHHAEEDPQRSLRLLRRAEQGHDLLTGSLISVGQTRLSAFAGALAAAGQADEAESLVTAIGEPNSRAWGCAAVSMAVAHADTGRALRLAEQAVELWFGADLRLPRVLVASLQALGRAGAAKRVAEIMKGFAEDESPLSPYDFDAFVESADAVRCSAPGLATQLIESSQGHLHDESPWDVARLLIAAGPHDSELAARLERMLRRRIERGPAEHRVLSSLLTAASDLPAARGGLDAMRDKVSPALCVAHAVLGDFEAARAIAQSDTDEERRAESFAHLAGWAACLTGGLLPVPLHQERRDSPQTVRRLAALLLGPPSDPDLPRARSLLADALTPDGWHHAVPVLAEIDPDAVLRIWDVVSAHVGLNDRGD